MASCTVTLTQGCQVAANITEGRPVEDRAEHLDHVAADHGGPTELLDNTEHRTDQTNKQLHFVHTVYLQQLWLKVK